MLRHAAFALLLLVAPGLAVAAPQSHRLDPAASTVGLEVDVGRPADSRVAVTLDAADAKASFPFATQALTGASVLATADVPEIRFETTAFRAQPGPGAKAAIDGTLTIRGVPRPVTLEAEIFRREGSDPSDLAALSVRMDTAVSRAAFGADGWADMVGDEVRIRSLARIDRAD